MEPLIRLIAQGFSAFGPDASFALASVPAPVHRLQQVARVDLEAFGELVEILEQKARALGRIFVTQPPRKPGLALPDMRREVALRPAVQVHQLLNIAFELLLGIDRNVIAHTPNKMIRPRSFVNCFVSDLKHGKILLPRFFSSGGLDFPYGPGIGFLRWSDGNHTQRV